MTQMEQKVYDMVSEAYKRHGSELVVEKYSNLKTCQVKENGDSIELTINTEVPYVNTWFDMMAEVEKELQEMGYEVANRKFMYDYLFMALKIS